MTHPTPGPGKSAPLAEGEEFVPAPLAAVPLDLVLPFPLYISVAGKMTCFRNIGDTLTADRKAGLQGKLDCILVPKSLWLGFIATLENQLDSAGKTVEEKASILHTVLYSYCRYLEEMANAHKETVFKLREFGYRLARLIHEYPTVMDKLLVRYQERGIYHANHNVNVAVYAVAIASKLKMRLEDMKQLAFACLVHNIGNVLVPKDLLYKPQKLSIEEWRVMQQHCYQGAQLLEVLNLPVEIVLTARHHHERMDGKGYPAGMVAPEVHPFAKICSISDVYDALISKRPYGQAPLKPREAIEQMKQMVGKFDPHILSIMGTA